MCHDFDPSSFEQVQGNWKKNHFHNYVRSTPFLWRKIGLHIKVALKDLIMRVCHEFDQVQL